MEAYYDEFLFTDDSRDFPAAPSSPRIDPSTLPLDCRGTPYVGFVVGRGMTGAGIFHRDLAVIDPEGAYRGGDLVVASAGGEAILRRLTMVLGIPHLINENDQTPELLLAVDTPLLGVVRAVLRLELTPRPPAPRIRVEYSRDGALHRGPDPMFPPLLRKAARKKTGARVRPFARKAPPSGAPFLLNETAPETPAPLKSRTG